MTPNLCWCRRAASVAPHQPLCWPAAQHHVRHHMSVTLRRVIGLCLASAIVPTTFVIGGLVFRIDALLNWPSWLLFVWPTSVMFNGLAGVTPPLTLLWASLMSIGINAVIWVAVGLPILWAAIDLPKSSSRKTIPKGQGDA